MKPSKYPPRSSSRAGSSDKHGIYTPLRLDVLNKASRGVTTGGGRPFSARTIARLQRPNREGR
jgi:hypothetical protein